MNTFNLKKKKMFADEFKLDCHTNGLIIRPFLFVYYFRFFALNKNIYFIENKRCVISEF